jgi:ribosomal-protein-alanine N-acetyltransferase
MTAHLHQATHAHVPALAAIHAGAFPRREAWSEDAFALQLAMPGVFGLVDARGGLILARVAADEAEVLTLAVAPTLRRKGIGRALLAGAMAMAAGEGAQSVVLEVAVGNAAARALYAAADFTEIGRRPRYYADGSDALVLRAALPAVPAASGAGEA